MPDLRYKYFCLVPKWDAPVLQNKNDLIQEKILAIALYQQSLELQEKIGNVQGKAATLHCMADIYANQGKIDEAIALFQQSLELKEKIGDVQGKAMTLWWLGGLSDQQGNTQQALVYLHEAFEILQRIKSPSAQSLQSLIQRIQNS